MTDKTIPGEAREPAQERNLLNPGTSAPRRVELEAREQALAAWLGPRVTHGPRDHAFRAGYDAARAEYERKVAELERRLEQVDAGRVAYAARVRELEAALETALATERESAAKVIGEYARRADQLERLWVRDDPCGPKSYEDIEDYVRGWQDRVRELEAHFEYHRREDTHALEASQRALADSESHCKALAQDLATERERIARLTEAMRQVRNTAIVVLGYRVDQIIEAALSATPPDAAPAVERLPHHDDPYREGVWAERFRVQAEEIDRLRAELECERSTIRGLNTVLEEQRVVIQDGRLLVHELQDCAITPGTRERAEAWLKRTEKL